MKIALITNMNRAKGNEVMIRSFCTAVSTSISGLASPKSKSAIVANSIKTDQTSRCFLFGSFLPLSVNILKTKTAESTDVTRKLINRKMVIKFRKVAIG